MPLTSYYLKISLVITFRLSQTISYYMIFTDIKNKSKKYEDSLYEVSVMLIYN